ncbi:RWD domain-containing protein 2A [Phymastichus coffea]|uniref:RWD domain-containing protein 2A n=1 Tax=Phymastichus coffea TaxID=108790 RepID=UPI00273AE637|nr:RWD domain-containing protein 2A [Phymastichus coffea]
MSITGDIKETLEIQINELEALQAVYPKEVSTSDHGNIADINDYIAGKTIDVPLRLEYEIEVPVDEVVVELLINLPLDYPNVSPQVYCRSSALDREEQLNFNKNLILFCESQTKGEPIVYYLINWIQDNAKQYFKRAEEHRNKKIVRKVSEDNSNKNICNEFGRYWIYSHHIYSYIKRRNIIDLAKESSLTGFSFIGKPGIICLEGMLDDCEYFWQQIKSWHWHRIIIKFIEKDFEQTDDFNKYRKFTDFQELSFVNCDRQTNHTVPLNFKNDTSQLLKFLRQHNSEHAFNQIFGFDTKCTE